MSINTVRACICLLVVGGFTIITGFLALWPLFSSANVDISQYSDFITKIASVYTGIIGVIVGFYFGRHEKKNATNVQDD